MNFIKILILIGIISSLYIAYNQVYTPNTNDFLSKGETTTHQHDVSVHRTNAAKTHYDNRSFHQRHTSLDHRVINHFESKQKDIKNHFHAAIDHLTKRALAVRERTHHSNEIMRHGSDPHQESLHAETKHISKDKKGDTVKYFDDKAREHMLGLKETLKKAHLAKFGVNSKYYHVKE